jgi:hypothetical protein
VRACASPGCRRGEGSATALSKRSYHKLDGPDLSTK